MSFKLEVEFDLQTCIKCGAQFAVSTQFMEMKQRDGGHIHCPKGHKNFWYGKDEPDVEELQAEVEQLKREKIQLIHDHDQENAAREAGKPQDIPAADPSPVAPAPPVEHPGVKCPKCEKRFKQVSGFLRNHLHDVHGMEAKEVENTISSIFRQMNEMAERKRGAA
jgi:hypothetical protein